MPTAPIQALYSQPVDLTLGDSSFQLLAGGSPVAGTVTTNGGLLVFNPSRPLADGVYSIALTGLEDVGGNPLAPVNTIFTVAAASADTSSPRLLSSSPANQAVGVDVTSAIPLTFSKPMSTVAATQLSVTSQGAGLKPDGAGRNY